ncbi:MAG: hypothetical protein OXC93_14615 [Rhodospirillaceae bacterium]|nr:hypothetical protein [Rhodospirillaceae bacterium]
MESAKALAQSGCLLPEDAAALLERSGQQLVRVGDTLAELQIASPLADQEGSDLLGEVVDPLFPERLDGFSLELAHALKSAFGAVADSLPSESAFDLIQSILGRSSRWWNQGAPAARH